MEGRTESSRGEDKHDVKKGWKEQQTGGGGGGKGNGGIYTAG